MRTCNKVDYPMATTNGYNGPILDTPDPFILNIPQVTQPKRELTLLKILTIVQLVMAILMVILDAISMGVISNNMLVDFTHICGGTGILVGIMGVVTAGLGIGAFWTAFGNKSLMMGHFVMCIIGTTADGILIRSASVCISMMRPISGYEHVAPGVKAFLATESFLLIAALAHFVTSILITAFVCRNWYPGGQPAVAAVYLPGSGVDGKEATACRVEIPTGAQGIFAPSDGGQQARVNPPPKYQ